MRHRDLGVFPTEPAWLRAYYQTANRLAFLCFARRRSDERPVWEGLWRRRLIATAAGYVWVTLWSPRGRSGSIPSRVESENASCWPRTTAAMLASGSGM